MFGRTTTRPLHTCLLASALALAGAGMVGPAHAQTAYDGPWSVVISTRGGPCPSTIRYGVTIVGGQIVNPAGGEADVRGRVTPRGAVSVTVRSGGASAVGTGSLGRLTGGGVWRGQSSSNACEGTWVAQRSGPITAQARGAPVYNYAPGPASRAVAARSAAGCEARFRSYDPATGTFLGSDGLRHRCR
jgi:hypothetical protein